VFRRRRRREQPEQTVAEAPAPAPMREHGPWDADEPHPDHDRIDLGGMRLPHNSAFDIRLASVGDQHVGVVVLYQESSLQLQALAAPKSSGLWEEIRAKIQGAASTLEEREGPFGIELAGKVTVEGGERPVRYLGVDGPRWFLLGVINGRAAVDEQNAQEFIDFMKDIVVVRGDEPMAREESIPLRRPNEQPAAEVPQREVNPFRRGPEISEIR
jgi:hypothetical protein